jgi:hypothetical protein
MFYFMETTHEPLQFKFGTIKYHGYSYRFYLLLLFCLTKLLNMAMVQNFEVILG